MGTAVCGNILAMKISRGDCDMEDRTDMKYEAGCGCHEIKSTPRDDGFRMPAEFERHHGCLMIWPERPGSWIYEAVAAQRAFSQIAAAIGESMLLRGANAVGYKNYPDNVIREFVKQSAKAGIDVFRIFDSLNWIQGMEVALDETLNQGMIAEPCLCYTGDILDSSKTKYTLSYYVKMADRKSVV